MYITKTYRRLLRMTDEIRKEIRMMKFWNIQKGYIKSKEA